MKKRKDCCLTAVSGYAVTCLCPLYKDLQEAQLKVLQPD